MNRELTDLAVGSVGSRLTSARVTADSGHARSVVHAWPTQTRILH